MGDVYLTISGKDFDKRAKEAIETADSNWGDDNAENKDMMWESLNLNSSELLFEDGQIKVSGDLILPETGENFGYLSADINLSFDIVIKIIETYVKRLQKLKTVLEATK